jgi:hypothetical protein
MKLLPSIPRSNPESPCLTFAPLAWLKLQFFCHAGDTEIGGFGLSSEQNLLYIEDFVTVRQRVTPFTVQFDDEAMADFFDQCVDQGLRPEQFSRIWCHTHPGASVTPSSIDEETFARCFGRCDWSLMFILGRTARTYARLAFAAGPGGQIALPTHVDWSVWPEFTKATRIDHELEAWRKEHAANIHIRPASLGDLVLPIGQVAMGEAEWWDGFPWHPELDAITYKPTNGDSSREAADRNPAPRA